MGSGALRWSCVWPATIKSWFIQQVLCYNAHWTIRADLGKVAKPLVETSCFLLIGMNSALVCVSGPTTGCQALMREKFALAKHVQIYEPASLCWTALTTDINKDSSGRLYHLGNWDACVRGSLFTRTEWWQMIPFTSLVHFGLLLMFVWTTFWHSSCYCHMSGSSSSPKMIMV